MKVEIESPRPSQRVLKVEVPNERVEEEFNSVYKSYKTKVVVPGFRKGKVPLSVLEARFGPRIAGEVLGKILPQAYKEATQREKLAPVDKPQLSEVEFKRGSPLRFKATVEVKPEVHLGNYLGMRATRRLMTITDEDVDKALDDLRHQKAILTPVDREAREGDHLIIRLREEGSAKEEEVELELGQGQLLPQFEAQLVGIARGKERQVEVNYPSTYPEARYQGRKVRFWVKPTEIKERRLPQLDEEFLKELGNFRSLRELKEEVRNNLQANAEVVAQKGIKEQIMGRLIEEVSLEVPESMIKTYLDLLVNQAKKSHKPVHEEEIRARYRSQAIREITASLIIEEIAKREGIETSPEEVEQRVREVARSYSMGEGEARDWLVKTGQMRNLAQRLKEEKVFEFLIGKAEIDTVWV